jgi:4-hydroxy-3-methylbut-2-enyl diphosphate reductase
VVGSQNSSNSKRLVEVAKNSGVPAYLVDDSSQVDASWIENARTVALTAGASAPENLVEDLIAYLSSRGFGQLEELDIKDEDVRFTLPAQLARVAPAPASITTQ